MESTYRKTDIMYVPALLLFAVFVVLPFCDGARIAFTNWNGFSQKYAYVGFSNFRRLFQDENVRIAFANTFAYGVGSTLLQQVLGLAYALLLNLGFPVRSVARAIVYLPVLLAAVVMGYMWYYLVQYDGALNDVLVALGGARRLWLSSRIGAVTLLTAINVLQFVGISMVIYLAGLQGIPAMYYEAAELDGAGSLARFRHITFPLLQPALVTSITINLIGGLKLFDVIMALTGGGPGYSSHSLATLLHTTYFGSQMAGYAAAVGLLLFMSILMCTVVLQIVFRKREVQLQ
jgi:raffinose/stachyose/melibiose transport system permease protein